MRCYGVVLNRAHHCNILVNILVLVWRSIKGSSRGLLLIVDLGRRDVCECYSELWRTGTHWCLLKIIEARHCRYIPGIPQGKGCSQGFPVYVKAFVTAITPEKPQGRGHSQGFPVCVEAFFTRGFFRKQYYRILKKDETSWFSFPGITSHR